MFERPQGSERALLVALDFGDADPADRMSELEALAVSAGATVVGKVIGKRQRPDAATYAGKGKVEEIAARRTETGADVVIFDHALSGVQQRNLERALECRVVDRTSLILDIFAGAGMARSPAGWQWTAGWHGIRRRRRRAAATE